MNIEYRKAFKEVIGVIECLSDEEREKIPKSLINVLKKESLKDYSPKIDFTKSIEEQKFSRKTIAILALIYNKYFKGE